MARGDQVAAQLGEVVGLTGVDHGHLTRGCADHHRLHSAGQINHRQPAVTESDVAA